MLKPLEETAEPETERSYAVPTGGVHLLFDPLKDLNLPASYEEARQRFEQLRAGRVPGNLN